jgi:hypothetical protein
MDGTGFESRQGQLVVLFSKTSGPSEESTQCPVQWVPRVRSLDVKRSEREPDHTPPSVPRLNVNAPLHP